jgi:ribosomal protein L7Ae-like RNA K-turn-binding protein
VKTTQVDRALGLLGIAYKGGNAVIGRDAVRESIQRQRARAVVLASDAGPSLSRELQGLAAAGAVPVHVLATRDLLGRNFGRAEIAVVGVTDAGLADAVDKVLRGEAPDAPERGKVAGNQTEQGVRRQS